MVADVRGLSPRRQQIMEMVCQGLTDKEIATQLGLAVSTIKNTLVGVYQILGARNRAHAAVLFVRG